MQLAKREHQVLALIEQKLTTAEIAQQLSLSISTIETHRRNIFRKVGVRRFNKRSNTPKLAYY